jgi:IS1 family transposase
VQRFKCLHCGKSFAEKTPLDGLRVPVEKVVQTIQLLCEGMGIRAISRFTGLRQKTVLSILEMAGQKAARLLDEQIRNVEVESVQCDEIFSFVGCKECNNKLKDPEHGTQYTFLAIDRKSKLIMSHFIGKRDRECADVFMADLRKRIKGRSQVTTDGFHGYLAAVYNAFGANVDFARQAKMYAGYNNRTPMSDERRYSIPKGCLSVKTDIHIGKPERALISTSHVERTNLSVRLFRQTKKHRNELF